MFTTINCFFEGFRDSDVIRLSGRRSYRSKYGATEIRVASVSINSSALTQFEKRIITSSRYAQDDMTQACQSDRCYPCESKQSSDAPSSSGRKTVSQYVWFPLRLDLQLVPSRKKEGPPAAVMLIRFQLEHSSASLSRTGGIDDTSRTACQMHVTRSIQIFFTIDHRSGLRRNRL